ncbi:MAG: helix-turn-helix transcriptional regulator [Bacilli bacterium]|nr:helix-turn-helix transcriptional regulator [Bacilli bacterium]MDD4808823.1 helix-turn-helix transcriptional regulator [Bacilli bacterium]
MFIGERLKQARIAAKITQEELGEMIGVSKVSICGYEKGTRTPTLESFILIVEKLGINPGYLLGLEHYSPSLNSSKVSIAGIDLKIIKEFKKYRRLYNRLCSDLEKTMEIISKRVN